jgi:allantoicase
MENGALPIAANNAHFGRVANLLAPGHARNMGDGWETRRRREPGHDWAIVALAQPGVLDEIEIDTSHFKGNYPDRCSIQAGPDAPLHPHTLVTQSMFWPVILSEQPLRADARHFFVNELLRHTPVRFLRINIFPDGGIARLRAWGKAVSC